MTDLDHISRFVEELEPGGRVLRRRRLRGGYGSRMDVLRIEDARGVRRTVVLRRYVPGWDGSSGRDAEYEYNVLGLLESAGIPAPRRLLLDAASHFFETPAMLLSYVPGRSFAAPQDVDRSIDELARGLACVHRITPDRFNLSWLKDLPDADISARVYHYDEAARDLPPVAHAAFKTLKSIAPDQPEREPCLIHGDFWPGNTVSYRGRLAAIIDWSEARLGNPREDVSQCRSDLVVSQGLEAADAFLAAYNRNAASEAEPLGFFDLLMGLRGLIFYKLWLQGYHEAGLTHLDAASVESRLSDFTQRALDSVTA